MKLTDFAIVFIIFAGCLVMVLHLKEDRIHSQSMNRIMYNNVMDGIVEDSLGVGFKSISNKGKPNVDLIGLKKCFEAETKLYGVNWRHILFFFDAEGFYCLRTDIDEYWSDKIMYPDVENTSHQDKMIFFMKYVQNNYDVYLNLPVNDGETWVNTIEDYSLFAISYNVDLSSSFVSGARIHNGYN